MAAESGCQFQTLEGPWLDDLNLQSSSHGLHAGRVDPPLIRRRQHAQFVFIFLPMIFHNVLLYMTILGPGWFFLWIYRLFIRHSGWVSYGSTVLAYVTRCATRETVTPLPGYWDGNRVKLLVNGHEALPAILQAIHNATQSLRWQVMLFQPDEVGRRIAQALMAAARRGVQVQLAFDVDSTVYSPIPFRYSGDKQQQFYRDMQVMLRELHAAGVATLNSGPGIHNPSHGLSRAAHAIQRKLARSTWISANHYDHRKILIVDDRLAIVGGMNVGNEYLYEIPPDISHDMVLEATWRQQAGLPEAWPKWQDVSVQIEGPAVGLLVREFGWRWEVLGGEPIPSPARIAGDGDRAVQVLTQRPGHEEVGAAYFNLIERAEKEIYVASPYVTYDGVLDALLAARKRGVRVVLVFPRHHNDSATVKRIFRWRSRRLVDSGIELYYNDLRMAHAKIMVVDGRWTVIGSFNLNYRSFRYDLEVAVIIDDEFTAHEARERVFRPYIAFLPDTARQTGRATVKALPARAGRRTAGGARVVMVEDMEWSLWAPFDWFVQSLT